ncbi:leader peptidase (prepilin peptidase) / N-methyltransferase [Blastococcus sp. DSM 46786]|uniref:prepilin peptidase n=1 Tax=Blastococcus sp. DSM 46786 TaxID=1798227 RepID=UPI0008BD7FE7|nr:prepilin peptidase [Blastococcus sp. DSM 46786]SEL40943.1 leader peptidase (prepilin peptidase) / N-methyltransferase [Blastococcus sp. DSM 46786]
MDVSHAVLTGVAVLAGLLLGPLLARSTVRLAARDDAATPSRARVALTAVLTAGLLAAAVLLGGPRPATAALAWAAGAAVVLAGVDLAAHRLPDRVLLPAAAVCGAALLVDAALLGTWPALVRALVAGAAALVLSGAARLAGPAALGFGDVKLLGLLGLVLGWSGWGVLLAGVFLGLLTGGLVSLALVATRRAGWRSTVPFGPPLLAGAVLALALGGVPPT